MANSWSACCLARLVIIHGKQKTSQAWQNFVHFLMNTAIHTVIIANINILTTLWLITVWFYVMTTAGMDLALQHSHTKLGSVASIHSYTPGISEFNWGLYVKFCGIHIFVVEYEI